MKRIHLFEWEDQAWLPAVIRDCVTDFLRFEWRAFGFYDGAVPYIERVLKHTESTQVVDLCSGASGPWATLLPQFLESTLTVTLTDKHPNIQGFETISAEANGQVGYLTESVDATRVPPDLKGVRTIFSGFHHFEPTVAREIIQDAVHQRAAICIFEMTGRSVFNVLATLIAGPLLVLLTTPFVKPARLSRIALTYLLPVVPLVYTWDAVVSHLRTYSADELREITGAVERQDFVWEIGRFGKGLFPVTYLLGYPATTALQDTTAGSDASLTTAANRPGRDGS